MNFNSKRMSVTIKRFIPQNAQINRAYLVIGKKGSCKSTVMLTLLSELCDRIDYAMAICGTRDGVEKLSRVMPPDVIHTTFDQALFSKIVNTLDRVSKAPGYSRITGLILDDLGFGRAPFRTDDFRKLLMNGRWLGVFLIITQQYLMDIGPDLRGNFDYIFAMAETAKKTRQKLYESYFGVFNSFADFDRVFTQVTAKKGRALVLDTTNSSNLVQDRVFYYDANPDVRDFVIGNERFRQHLSRVRIQKQEKKKSEQVVDEDMDEALVI